MSLDGALLTLLYNRSARAAFLRGDMAALDLTDEERDAAATIDKGELESAARLACRGLFERSNRGTGSLQDGFTKTISAFNGSLDDLAATFAESKVFADYRVLPTCEGGISLEEAFFRFAEDAKIGDAATRKSELVHAIVRALAVTPSPSFSVPSVIHRAPGGWFGIVDGPKLVATTNGRFLTGALTPFLADLLVAPPEKRFSVAARHGATPSVLDTSVRELAAMGLI